MRQFFIKILIIFLPVFVTVIYTERILRSVPNNYRYKDMQMHHYAHRVKILNLGASHAYYGICPSLFHKSAFNLAFVSQSLNYDFFLFKKYIGICDSIEYLILPISYLTYRWDLDNSIERWRAKGYYIYMGCDSHECDISYNLEITSKEKLFSIVDVIFDSISYINCDSFGWGTSYRKNMRNENWQSSGYVACTRHTNNSQDYVEDNVQYLQDIINDCVIRKIKVIILTTPTHKSYYEFLESSQLTEMEEICKRFDYEYENVIYLNWLKHGDFTDEDFYDSDHLNEYGAEKLTRMLDQYIMNWQ